MAPAWAYRAALAVAAAGSWRAAEAAGSGQAAVVAGIVAAVVVTLGAVWVSRARDGATTAGLRPRVRRPGR